jgi:hypothetical protein
MDVSTVGIFSGHGKMVQSTVEVDEMWRYSGVSCGG